MKFEILNTEVFGYEKAIKASGNPMRVVFDRDELTDKDINRAYKLGATQNGQGHDNFLKGIVVQFDIIAPLYWWKQAQRYHWFSCSISIRISTLSHKSRNCSMKC